MDTRGEQAFDDGAQGRRTLLIVDDDAQTRWTLSELLADTYDVLLAESGEKALDLVRSRSVHLILLDVHMPRLDGFQTCAILKQRQETADIPVIFLTSDRDPGREVRAFSLGAVDYLTKPFRLSLLKARIARHMLRRPHPRHTPTLGQDDLTGVLGRPELDRVLEHEWKEARRRATRLSLILLRVDDFERYSQLHGHLAGNECLCQVAAAVSACLRRPDDALGRFAEDAFLAILPATTRFGAQRIQQAMCDAVAALALPPLRADRPLCISFGLASHLPYWSRKGADRTLKSVLQEAERDLREAGRNTGNRVELASR